MDNEELEVKISQKMVSFEKVRYFDHKVLTSVVVFDQILSNNNLCIHIG